MFYCRACGEARKWPTYGGIGRSLGMCEICQKRAICWDVPSSRLPLPPPDPGSGVFSEERAAIESIKKSIATKARTKTKLCNICRVNRVPVGVHACSVCD